MTPHDVQESVIMAESATHQYSSYDNSTCSTPYIYDSADHAYVPPQKKPRYALSVFDPRVGGSGAGTFKKWYGLRWRHL